MSLAKTIMLQGTASDVGKSVVTTAICRMLNQDGWKVAPYKSQNMALNSYVTLDGKEIGRAQGVQAEACGIAATTDMNPILIKPTREMAAQIVVHGKPHEEMSARRYREEYLPFAATIVRESLERLRAEYDVVVIEGAGSPAEINLKSRDIVNMRVAEWADAPVLLVADIDRGGAFASLVGTLELLDESERRRVKGFIINKFRGDLSLLQPGLLWLEDRTGIPVLGVIPHLPDLDIEAEDSLSLDRRDPVQPNCDQTPSKELEIAVIRLPRISNFTDLDPLMAEPDVTLRYVQSPDELQHPDAIILPGSKNTLEDLAFLQKSGLADLIRKRAAEGGRIVGICGGYQMLGTDLTDPDQIESDLGAAEGLGLLPVETTFVRKKRTLRVSGTVCAKHPEWLSWQGVSIEGYEIHMGRTVPHGFVTPLFQLGGERDGALSEDGKVWGTYLHGVFHNDSFRRKWLDALRVSKGLAPIETPMPFQNRQEAAFDRLAAHVRSHLQMDKFYEIIRLPAEKV